MSTDVRSSVAAKNAVLASFPTTFENAVIHVYSGTAPSTLAGGETGAHVGTISKDGGAFVFGTATNGLNFTVSDGKVVKATAETWILTGLEAAGASGTDAGYAVLYPNGAGNTGADPGGTKVRILLTIGTTTGFFKMASRRIVSGGKYAINSFEMTWPD